MSEIHKGSKRKITKKLRALAFFTNFFSELYHIINGDRLNFIIITILITLFSITIILIKIFIKNPKITLPQLKRRDFRSGKLFLGKVKSNFPPKKFYLSLQDLKKHIFVCGLTGMGKTNFIKFLLRQLNRILPKTPFLLIEFKGDYDNTSCNIKNCLYLSPGNGFTINIFDPLGEDSQVYANRLLNSLVSCQMISFQDEFSAQMEQILIEILRKVCEDPLRRNWDGFDYYSKRIEKRYRSLSNIKQTIMGINNRLRAIKSGSLKKIFENHSDLTFQEIMDRKVILDLSSIINLGGSKNDSVFFANMVFNKIWQTNLKRGKCEEIRHFTFIEDSIYFSSQNHYKNEHTTTFLEDFALLLRGTGECLITINTRPNISEDIMANSGLIVAFQSAYDQKEICKLLALNENRSFLLTQLDIGECIVKTNSIKTPFLLKVPLIKNSSLVFWKKIMMKIINVIKIKCIFKKHKGKKKSIKKNTKSTELKNAKKNKNEITKMENKQRKEGKPVILNSNINVNSGEKRINSWKQLMKEAENLYLIGEYRFAYQKCNLIYLNFLKVFASKWSIDMRDDRYQEKTIDKLHNISKTLYNICIDIGKLKKISDSGGIVERNIEIFISLLKRLFLIIKISKNDQLFEESIKKKEGNFENKSKEIRAGNDNKNNNKKNLRNFKTPIYDESELWDLLKEKIEIFENQ